MFTLRTEITVTCIISFDRKTFYRSKVKRTGIPDIIVIIGNTACFCQDTSIVVVKITTFHSRKMFTIR